jgi:CRP-like cAMP-binding protein
MRYVGIDSNWLGHSNCEACPVREDALLSALDPLDCQRLYDQLDDVEFPRTSVLFHQGAPAEALFTVQQGAVKLIRYLSNGEQRIVRVLKPGDIAGLEAAVSQLYGHTAVTLGAARLCRMPAELVTELSRHHPSLQQRLLVKYQKTLDEADAWLAELAAGSAPARVRLARLLLRLRVSANSDQIFRFSLEDVGAMLGITIETASRVIAALKREGVLREENGSVRLYQANIPALLAIALPEEKDF